MQIIPCKPDEVKVIVHERDGSLRTAAEANQGIRLRLSDNHYVDLEVTPAGLEISGNGAPIVVEPRHHGAVRINVMSE